MNILEQILDVKRREVEQIQDTEFGDLVRPKRSLKGALSAPGISVIAEIKMKSPSEGEIMPNVDPIQIAKDYESAGAAAISVLTDEQFFGGSLEILKSVRDTVSIPVIRKDFIIDKKQIAETVHYQADAFLLIADAIDQDTLQQLMNDGKTAGLEFLVEYHDEEHSRGAWRKVLHYEDASESRLWEEKWLGENFPLVLAVFWHSRVGEGYSKAISEMRAVNTSFYGRNLEGLLQAGGMDAWVNIEKGDRENVFPWLE